MANLPRPIHAPIPWLAALTVLTIGACGPDTAEDESNDDCEEFRATLRGGPGAMEARFDDRPWEAVWTTFTKTPDSISYMGSPMDGSWQLMFILYDDLTPGTHRIDWDTRPIVAVFRDDCPDLESLDLDGYIASGTLVVEEFDFEAEQIHATFDLWAPGDRPPGSPFRITDGRLDFPAQ